MTQMIKFTQSGFYNIRGQAVDVKNMEFPLIEGFKMGKDQIGYVTVDGGYQPGFPTRNIRIKCDESSFDVIDEADKAAKRDETDEEIIERLRGRFEILEDMTQAVKEGTVRAMIVTGPPGVGKSFGVDKVLHKEDLFNMMGERKAKYEVVKGAMSAIGLYCKLYEYADKGNVVVFDDCDSVLLDDLSLNILKAALDSSTKRMIHWNTDSSKLRSEGVPGSFEFKAGAIFITNIKFENVRSKKLQDHLAALESRCHYVDLQMDTEREKVLRIKQITKDGMLDSYGFENGEEDEVIQFIDDQKAKLRELSLRTVLKIADLRKSFPSNWKNMAEVTVMKTGRA
jgi:hypothetical protein|tara:strand:- start:1049 stop:2068 length:1020 start_codon:yes stop_codon:yes gene_type:complete